VFPGPILDDTPEVPEGAAHGLQLLPFRQVLECFGVYVGLLQSGVGRNGIPRLRLVVVTDDGNGLWLCRGCGDPPLVVGLLGERGLVRGELRPAPADPARARAEASPSLVFATISPRWSSASTDSIPNIARSSLMEVSMPCSMSNMARQWAGTTLPPRPPPDLRLSTQHPMTLRRPSP
jgi:hypothetical protein